MQQGEGEKGRPDGLSGEVIGACIEVHRHLGPGLLESAYEYCVCRELTLRGLSFERQRLIPLRYKGVDLDCDYRADVVVEGSLLLEIKAVEQLLPVHQAQVITYLRLMQLQTGLLVNFHVAMLKQGGIRRLTNQLLSLSSPSPFLPVKSSGS